MTRNNLPQDSKKSLEQLHFDIKKVGASVSYYDSLIQKPIADQDKLDEMKIKMKICRDQILNSCLQVKEDLRKIKKDNSI